MTAYTEDREWSDRFIPTIRQIVGPLLLVESPLEVDRQQATDLIVFKARDMMIAARVRRPGFSERYGRQFTIRSHRDNGAKTELSKVVEGFADWMFYGHALDYESTIIDPWLLIDLNAFRAHLIREKDELRTGHTDNRDGTWFAWFDVDSFTGEPPLLISSSEDEELPE